MHETKEGQYDFSGDNDLVAFIEMANSAGLLVLVRAGDWTQKENRVIIRFWKTAHLPLP